MPPLAPLLSRIVVTVIGAYEIDLNARKWTIQTNPHAREGSNVFHPNSSRQDP
jgi:hypothetical protein